LLAYSRIKTRALPHEPVACNEAVEEALANLQMAVREVDAQIEVGSLPTVEGDPTQLVQLFQNLIGNALRFRGEAPLRVRIGAVPEGDCWRISVADNGIGIEPQFFERVFVIFQRLHTADEYPGTGIGLALCKQIVERHGGRIWLESGPGAGAAFHFTLPAAPTGGESVATPVSPEVIHGLHS
ncbi:MAG: histidine kinase, partial [Myxococcales bacterium]|nr:histidine kinase [Myxococcales bacterium]